MCVNLGMSVNILCISKYCKFSKAVAIIKKISPAIYENYCSTFSPDFLILAILVEV